MIGPDFGLFNFELTEEEVEVLIKHHADREKEEKEKEGIKNLMARGAPFEIAYRLDSGSTEHLHQERLARLQCDLRTEKVKKESEELIEEQESLKGFYWPRSRKKMERLMQIQIELNKIQEKYK
jgi:hypothetical protein